MSAYEEQLQRKNNQIDQGQTHVNKIKMKSSKDEDSFKQEE